MSIAQTCSILSSNMRFLYLCIFFSFLFKLSSAATLKLDICKQRNWMFGSCKEEAKVTVSVNFGPDDFEEFRAGKIIVLTFTAADFWVPGTHIQHYSKTYTILAGSLAFNGEKLYALNGLQLRYPWSLDKVEKLVTLSKEELKSANLDDVFVGVELMYDSEVYQKIQEVKKP